MIAFIKCPLCEWALEQKPLDPRLNADTLAGVFGPGIALQTALNQRAQETERALETHLKTHTLVEWVKKVGDQQREIEQLRGAAQETKVGPKPECTCTVESGCKKQADRNCWKACNTWGCFTDSENI